MNPSTLIHVGVIGAGRIGKVHAEHLAYRVPNARLAAVSDIDMAAARECADRFHGTQAYSDAEPILADPGIGAVAICSSTNTHAPLIEAAAAAGKHIFCEKPIDFDLDRIGRCLQTVDKAGVKFQVGFNRRFDPNFWEVRRQITEGRVGDVQIVRITSRDPAPPPVDYIRVSGGMFLDMTIHDFDMARYLVDSEVETVYAAGGVMVDPAIGQAGDIDTALITLHFANGALACIDNCRRAVYGYDQRVEVFGSKGMVHAGNNTPTRTQLCDEAGIHSPLPLHFFMDRYIDSYVLEMKLFIEAIVNDTPPPVTGQDGLAPVVIGLAAKRSLAENRPVKVAEIR